MAKIMFAIHPKHLLFLPPTMLSFYIRSEGNLESLIPLPQFLGLSANQPAVA